MCATDCELDVILLVIDECGNAGSQTVKSTNDECCSVGLRQPPLANINHIIVSSEMGQKWDRWSSFPLYAVGVLSFGDVMFGMDGFACAFHGRQSLETS